MLYTAIVTSHTNIYLSGVAKFNNQLARRLNIPCRTVEELESLTEGPLLLSIKLVDNTSPDFQHIERLFAHLEGRGIVYDLFLHAYDGLEIEGIALENARRVFASDAEILSALEGFETPIIPTFCPSLLDDPCLNTAQLNLFSFGMAHKLQVRFHKNLNALLSQAGADFNFFLSTAFHEKAGFGNFAVTSKEMEALYGKRMQMLGFLSDHGVNYFLDKSHLFVAFFDKGVRANNTSIYAAMERGCAVLTNTDQHSPAWMKHGVNMLDLRKATPDELSLPRLKMIGAEGKKDVLSRHGWEALIAIIAS